MVCLIGALIAATAIMASYQAREQARTDNERSVLAQHDIAHLETALSQWFTTIDLFFNAQQAYLASGIAKQSSQMQNIIDLIEVQLASKMDDATIFEALHQRIELISKSVSKAAITENLSGSAWNAVIDQVDENSIEVVTAVELISEWADIHAKSSQTIFESKDLWFNIVVQFSLANYLFLVFIVWRWANSNIVSPIERLISQTREAEQLIENISEQNFNFKLKKGPKEVKRLSEGLQKFVDSLQESRRNVQRRNQTIEQQAHELQLQMEALKETRLQLVQSEKMASVGQLAAGVAHEINNPVGFISSNLATLQEYIEDIKRLIAKQNECIDIVKEKDSDNEVISGLEDLRDDIGVDFILDDVDNLLLESIDGANRVRKIVEDLSEFTHVNSQDKIEEDINILLDRTTNLLNAQLGDDIQVIREFSELKTVTAEGGKLGQLFANLISNAIEAIEAKGQITLRTTQLEQSVQIDIVDTGRGIAEDKMATIFDPFYTTKDIGEGTGLGLHIAQSIVESHGGQLKASSESGKGTTLTVTLPATGSLGDIDDVGGIGSHALPETADTDDTNKPQLKAV